ncbi:hypothetical protein BDV30DRAFT_227580 [Aspergillus minisclerotigenes]|uniref:AMP-dependent synthetase/ligase domain-containing protein n=1 Tax=Aspergillus minisclerotigenes TaxID=656917 RepID=A0A5N6J0M3_9EURO|nr:hypothetical protein BDV30DRAFT_227580 [Aspergillus minisclerotigenes]
MTNDHCVTKLPNDPIFHQLLKLAKAGQDAVIVDPAREVNADFTQILTDLLQMRREIYARLPTSIFNGTGLVAQEAPFYTFILAPTSYLVFVASYAALSVGFGIAILSPEGKPSDALRLLQKARSSVILADPLYIQRAIGIQQFAASQGTDIVVIPITFNNLPPKALSELNIDINPTAVIDPGKPGVLACTSGTAGPGKLVVHARKILLPQVKVGDTHVHICCMGVVWLGILVQLLKAPLSGDRLEITAPTAAAIWERLRIGKVTQLRCTALIWTLLMQYYRECIIKRAPEQVGSYLRGLRGLRVAINYGQPLPSHVGMFWTEELGLPLWIGYGATEMGDVPIMRRAGPFLDDKNRIGKARPGMVVKLSQGDHGEILVKTPNMFLGYLDDPEATKACFDEDGFYKSSDIAHLVDDEYIFDGRTQDYIKYYSIKTPILLLEARILKLPYIAEAYVLAIPDTDSGQRAGALVRLQSTYQEDEDNSSVHPFNLAIERLRADLSVDLPSYTCPTVMHILQEGDIIPRTESNKVNRRKAAELYFTSTDVPLSPKVRLWDEEYKRHFGSV